MSQNDVIQIGDAGTDAVIILDDRYFPILVQTWRGAPTMAMAEKFYHERRASLARAKQIGTKCIAISDLSNMSSPPATVRKFLGDAAKVEDDVDEFVGYVACVPSAIMRGVVTALKWIVGDDVKPVVMVGSIDEAFARARKILESQGVNVPVVDYTPPVL